MENFYQNKYANIVHFIERKRAQNLFGMHKRMLFGTDKPFFLLFSEFLEIEYSMQSTNILTPFGHVQIQK